MSLLVTRSIFFSVVLHALAVALLIFSLDFSPDPVQPLADPAQIIDATAIDSKQVEQEMAQLKELEQKKVNDQRELEQKVQDLEKKSRTAEQKRREEEVKLTDLKKQQLEEEKKVKEEELKLADAKLQQEELKKQAEVEQKRKEEALAKAEAEKKKKEAEEALKKQMAAEQAAEQAAQDRQDLTVIQQYTARIKAAIAAEYNLLGLVEPGLSCIIFIRMSPAGDVVISNIAKSSGNAIFDDRAIQAVTKAQPLPVPEDARVFAKMREINLTFKPN